MDHREQMWIVMEYCERKSIFDLIREKNRAWMEENTPFTVRLKMLIDICRAMNFLHQVQG